MWHFSKHEKKRKPVDYELKMLKTNIFIKIYISQNFAVIILIFSYQKVKTTFTLICKILFYIFIIVSSRNKSYLMIVSKRILNKKYCTSYVYFTWRL